MTATELYQVYLDLTRSNLNGRIQIDAFQRLLNRAQVEYMMEIIDPKQKKTEVDGSKRTQNALLPFRKPVPVTLDNGQGAFAIDDDFMYGPIAFTVTGYVNDCNEVQAVRKRREIDITSDAEWADRTSSTISIPTHKRPIARPISKTDTESIVQVEPWTITTAEFVYYRKPRDIYIGRTATASGRFELDPADPNNVDPEWYDLDMNQIFMRACNYTGMSLSWDRLIGYTQRKMEAGT